MSRAAVAQVSFTRGSSIRCHFWRWWLKYSFAQVAQILVSTWLRFSLTFTSVLHYRTKQAGYSPQHGVNLQASAFCLQAEKTVHPSQSLPKSVRLLKMPFLAPICTPLSNSEHCVRVVTLLRTELIVTEYLKKYLRQNEPWAKNRLWLPVFGVFLPVRWGVRVLLGNRKQINPVHRQ